MSTGRPLAVLLVAALVVGFGPTYSGDRADAQSNLALHIDVARFAFGNLRVLAFDDAQLTHPSKKTTAIPSPERLV